MSAAAHPVTVADVDLDLVSYRGQRVVTFGMVDTVHQRPDGTAGRTFRENRERFIERDDFAVLDQPDEIRRLGFSRPQGGTPDKIILLTRRGYLKLVKPLSDDRAWEVQGEMIDRYFAVEGRPRIAPPPSGKVAIEAFRLFMAAKRAGRAIGLDDNQAALSANQATVATMGISPLALMGSPHLLAPQQERLLTPTDIGRELGGESARSANVLLQRHGFQVGPEWEPTDKGRPFAVFQDTGKR